VLLLREEKTVVQVLPCAPRPVYRHSHFGPPAAKDRRVRSIPRWTGCWSASMRGIRAGARTGRCRDAASRF